MSRRYQIVIGTLLLLVGAASPVSAQQPDLPLIVAVTCTCDRAALQKAVPFVTIVAPQAGADVQVVVSTQGDFGTGFSYTFGSIFNSVVNPRFGGSFQF